MIVTIFDYGVGNLHSLTKALLTMPGAAVRVETDPIRAAREAEILVLPGVGAFGPAATRLAPGREALRRSIGAGLPVLGICLGMQLLYDRSEEGEGEGLGVLDGSVTRLAARRTPQMGWNAITDATDPLIATSGLCTAYYANSFVCRSREPAQVGAWTTYETDRFPALARSGRVVGVQFHPEKSSAPGTALLRAFLAAAT
jgi:glutamine amidotransferase